MVNLRRCLNSPTIKTVQPKYVPVCTQRKAWSGSHRRPSLRSGLGRALWRLVFQGASVHPHPPRPSHQSFPLLFFLRGRCFPRAFWAQTCCLCYIFRGKGWPIPACSGLFLPPRNTRIRRDKPRLFCSRPRATTTAVPSRTLRDYPFRWPSDGAGGHGREKPRENIYILALLRNQRHQQEAIVMRSSSNIVFGEANTRVSLHWYYESFYHSIEAY